MDGFVLYDFRIDIRRPETLPLARLSEYSAELAKLFGVPVWLEGENREELACNASKTLAKELAARIFGEPVRVTGTGKWRRSADRIWELREFNIKTWEPLADAALSNTVAGLRNVPGNGWSDMADPQAPWRRLRGSE